MKRYLAIAALALMLGGCSFLQSLVNAAPSVVAAVDAACAAVPGVEADAGKVLKGGALNTANSTLASVQSACAAATADAPGVLAALAAIEAQVKAASAAPAAPASN